MYKLLIGLLVFLILLQGIQTWFDSHLLKEQDKRWRSASELAINSLEHDNKLDRKYSYYEQKLSKHASSHPIDANTISVLRLSPFIRIGEGENPS